MCIGWLDGRQTTRWRCVTTGSAYFSAMRPSGAIASAPLVVVMISGFSAAAIHSAKVAIIARIGVRRRGDVARLHRAERLRHRRRQRLARQREIDRPARARHGDLIGARDDVGDLLGNAQLVVPLHRLAQHPALVEHLLAPVDVAVAAAELALLGDRRAAGGEDERDVVAVEIDDVVDGVGGADVDVQHHRLRPAVHRIGAVRHGDREVLVRDDQRLSAPWRSTAWRG